MLLQGRKSKSMPSTDVVSMPGKIWQEFYCTKSGGGCGGYIMVKLNMEITGIVKVICPKCKHEHRRVIENGHLRESFANKNNGSRNDKTDQEIIPTMAAYSEMPRTTSYLTADFNKDYGVERTCPIVKDPAKDIGSQILRESWVEKHGVGKGIR